MTVTQTKVNVEEVLGHYVEAKVLLQGYVGKVEQVLTGKIIFSDYNATLFFKPKGNKNRGYLISNENDILEVKVIRKDKANNEYYRNAYNNKEQSEKKLNERLEAEERQREEQWKQRQERIELEQKLRKEQEQKEIKEAASLGGYEELVNDVISFYKSFEGEFFNEKFVTTTYIPILNKLIHKGIQTIDDYPKHYFDKNRNPKFCALIENKLNIKLTKTQKGNVKLLNEYLAS